MAKDRLITKRGVSAADEECENGVRSFRQSVPSRQLRNLLFRMQFRSIQLCNCKRVLMSHCLTDIGSHAS